MSGMTDCHLHIFGPTARYPYTANRAYTPPEASLTSYDALAASLGLERMVIVQPSVYGKTTPARSTWLPRPAKGAPA
jgi:predicted TIM-barrel fold metal-dependent hydrolase